MSAFVCAHEIHFVDCSLDMTIETLLLNLHCHTCYFENCNVLMRLANNQVVALCPFSGGFVERIFPFSLEFSHAIYNGHTMSFCLCEHQQNVTLSCCRQVDDQLLSQFTRVRKLHLYQCNVMILRRDLPSIEELSLHNCIIVELKGSRLPLLRELFINGQDFDLFSMPLIGFPSLQDISLKVPVGYSDEGEDRVRLIADGPLETISYIPEITGMHQLPPKLLLQICKDFSYSDLSQLAQTCKRMRKVLHSDAMQQAGDPSKTTLVVDASRTTHLQKKTLSFRGMHYKWGRCFAYKVSVTPLTSRTAFERVTSTQLPFAKFYVGPESPRIRHYQESIDELVLEGLDIEQMDNCRRTLFANKITMHRCVISTMSSLPISRMFRKTAILEDCDLYHGSPSSRITRISMQKHEPDVMSVQVQWLPSNAPDLRLSTVTDPTDAARPHHWTFPEDWFHLFRGMTVRDMRLVRCGSVGLQCDVYNYWVQQLEVVDSVVTVPDGASLCHLTLINSEVTLWSPDCFPKLESLCMVDVQHPRFPVSTDNLPELRRITVQQTTKAIVLDGVPVMQFRYEDEEPLSKRRRVEDDAE